MQKNQSPPQQPSPGSSGHSQAWKKKCALLYTISFVILGLDLSGLGPMIPFKASKAELLETQYGVVFSLRGIGYLVFSFIVPKLEERYSAHSLLGAGMGIAAITCYFGGLESSPWAMAFWFCINGAGCSMIDIISQISIIEVYGDQVDPYMQFLHFCYGLGSCLSPLVVAYYGQSAYTLYAFACLCCLLAALVVDSPKIHKQNTKKVANHQQNQPLKPAEDTDVGKQIPTSTDWLIRIFFFSYVGIEVAYGGWVATYATMTELTSKESAALSSAVFWACITAGRLAAVPLALRYTTKDMLLVLIVGCIGSSILNMLFILVGKAILAVYMGSALFGLAMSAVYPTLMSLPNYLGLKTKSSNLSGFVISGATGESLVPVFVGLLLDLCGANTLYVSALILSSMFYVCFYRILAAHSKETNQQKSAIMLGLIDKKQGNS